MTDLPTFAQAYIAFLAMFVVGTAVTAAYLIRRDRQDDKRSDALHRERMRMAGWKCHACNGSGWMDGGGGSLIPCDLCSVPDDDGTDDYCAHGIPRDEFCGECGHGG